MEIIYKSDRLPLKNKEALVSYWENDVTRQFFNSFGICIESISPLERPNKLAAAISEANGVI